MLPALTSDDGEEMYGIAFEWDSRKDSANGRKHGVGFAEVSTVFDDPLSITISDRDNTSDEERFVIIGVSEVGSLLVVVHTVRGERSVDQRSSSGQI